MQELPSRQATPNQRWFNAGPPSTTLEQRHSKIDSTSRVRRAPTFENPTAKLETTTKEAPLLGHRLGRRPNNKTTSVCWTSPPGNAGISKQKP